MKQQHFGNHTRMAHWTYYFSLLLALVGVIGSSVKLYRSCTTGISGLLVPIVLLCLSLSAMIAIYYIRMNALIAQDRAIRAEESLRHFILTGQLPNPSLRISQIIALRFASDEELPALSQRAISENLTPKQIKMAIQTWRADFHRV